MNRIKRGSANEFEGLIEVEAAFCIIYEALHVAQSCVAFVAVVNIFLDTQLFQQQDAADAEQVFLAQAVLPIAAVEGVRYRAIIFGILKNICV